MVVTVTSACNSAATCRYCGGYHGALCPTVKAIEYYEDGSVKRVEFKGASDYAPYPIPYYQQPMPAYPLTTTWAGAQTTGGAMTEPRGVADTPLS